MLALVRGAPLAVLGPFLSRPAAVGVVLALATGLLLWSVRPRAYLENPVFLWKLALLALTLLNVGQQHTLGCWRKIAGDQSRSGTTRWRMARPALLAGRWIGFV